MKQLNILIHINEFIQIMEPKKDARGSNCESSTINKVVYSYNNVSK